MFGKRPDYILLLIISVILVGCSKFFREHDNDISKGLSTQVVSNPQSLFSQRLAEDFLSPSLSFSYPENVTFIPTRLTDNGIVVGEAYDEGREYSKYLGSYDLKTEEFTKLKELDKTSDLLTVGVYYADSEYLFFEEYDSINQSSRYYIWDFMKKEYKLVHQTNNTPPLHYTQATRYKNNLYLNLYVDFALYKTYRYNIDNHQISVIDDSNSSSPIVYNGTLHYIMIDNQALETSILSNELSVSEPQNIYQTSGSSTYLIGLFSNGKDFLYLQQEGGETMLYRRSSQGQNDKLYSDTWIESLEYQNRFISFIGNPRLDDRVRPQYYLMDIENKIDYIYDDGPILLSKSGIFWIDFDKPEAEIEKGNLYSNGNSTMRYYPFEKR